MLSVFINCLKSSIAAKLGKIIEKDLPKFTFSI